MDQDRKKRTRSDQEGDQEKNTKLAKRQSEQGFHRNHNAPEFGSTSFSSHEDDRDSGDTAEPPGVFDFPWLKDGDEWKFEDSLESSLLGETGVEFSISGQCLIPPANDPVAEYFAEEKCGGDAELCPPLLEDFGLETAESLDCIWSAFA